MENKIKKLNLGCGKDYRKGWVNLDIGKEDVYGEKINADVYWDLNKYPYPFEKKEFKNILSIGVLEHMQNLEKHIAELSRISKKGCKIKIHVPYFLSYYSGRELYTHKFSLNNMQLFGIFKKNGFKITEKKLIIGFSFIFRLFTKIINSSNVFKNFVERFPLIIPSAIEWELIKK